MYTRIITLCYRKIIDINVVKPWDKLVFDDSYAEFKIQAQQISYGTPYTSYAELLRNVPAAKNLSALVTPAISSYVQQLNETVPEILNNLGRRFLIFRQFQFELINSDINDKNKHQIAVNFFTEPLVWYDTISNYLLIGHLSQTTEDIYTHLFQLQPYLSIHSIKTGQS